VDKSTEILNLIKKNIQNLAPDAEIYLYGSRARGDSNLFSDWDLLILLNTKQVSFDYETQLMDSLYDVELETGEVISPLFYPKDEWYTNYSITPFFENIQNEGIKI
jgi:predicted nucleotidyltransferase